MTVQIRTTHVGSLPRTDDLLKANAAHAEGRLDDADLAAVVRAQTDAVVARQTDIGLSIVNDGEYGHAMTEKVDYGAWWFYTFERFSGLEVIDPERAAARRPAPEGRLELDAMTSRRDWVAYADAYSDHTAVVHHRVQPLAGGEQEEVFGGYAQAQFVNAEFLDPHAGEGVAHVDRLQHQGIAGDEEAVRARSVIATGVTCV